MVADQLTALRNDVGGPRRNREILLIAVPMQKLQQTCLRPLLQKRAGQIYDGRVGNAVQYEVIGTWVEDQQADLSKPVKGREYLERRKQAADRVEAVENKLKTVTGDTVREWRGRQDRKTHRWFALVPRENRERFLAALRTAGGSEGIRLRLSGPWPPSEFVTPRGVRG